LIAARSGVIAIAVMFVFALTAAGNAVAATRCRRLNAAGRSVMHARPDPPAAFPRVSCAGEPVTGAQSKTRESGQRCDEVQNDIARVFSTKVWFPQLIGVHAACSLRYESATGSPFGRPCSRSSRHVTRSTGAARRRTVRRSVQQNAAAIGPSPLTSSVRGGGSCAFHNTKHAARLLF